MAPMRYLETVADRTASAPVPGSRAAAPRRSWSGCAVATGVGVVAAVAADGSRAPRSSSASPSCRSSSGSTALSSGAPDPDRPVLRRRSGRRGARHLAGGRVDPRRRGPGRGAGRDRARGARRPAARRRRGQSPPRRPHRRSARRPRSRVPSDSAPPGCGPTRRGAVALDLAIAAEGAVVRASPVAGDVLAVGDLDRGPRRRSLLSGTESDRTTTRSCSVSSRGGDRSCSRPNRRSPRSRRCSTGRGPPGRRPQGAPSRRGDLDPAVLRCGRSRASPS